MPLPNISKPIRGKLKFTFGVDDTKRDFLFFSHFLLTYRECGIYSHGANNEVVNFLELKLPERESSKTQFPCGSRYRSLDFQTVVGRERVVRDQGNTTNPTSPFGKGKKHPMGLSMPPEQSEGTPESGVT